MSMRLEGEMIGKLGRQFLMRVFKDLRQVDEGWGLTEERGLRGQGQGFVETSVDGGGRALGIGSGAVGYIEA